MLNILYVTLPFYLLFIFNKTDFSWMFNNSRSPQDQKLRAISKAYLTILSMLIVVLMMEFPLLATPNHSFDLRQVPVIIGFFYIGRRYGILLFLTLLVTRFFIGGQGVYSATLTNICLLIFLFLLNETYKKSRVRKKVIWAVALSVISGFLILFNNYIFFNKPPSDLIIPLVYLTCIQSLGLFVTIYSLEKFRNDQLIRERLRKTEKSQIVSELAASVSHEVRNPLTVTKGFLQLALKENLSDKSRNYLLMAQEELGRAEEIINDYLTFAKPAIDRPQVLSIKKELESATRLLSPFVALNGVVLETELMKDLYISGESKKFQQCLSNLIKNAVEACGTGGEIKVKTSQQATSVVISIQDNGSGMTQEDLRRIGEPYYSTKEKGTGLGMMVVFSIIHSMKGSLKIDSELGKGTTFFLTFPLVDAPLETRDLLEESNDRLKGKAL